MTLREEATNIAHCAHQFQTKLAQEGGALTTDEGRNILTLISQLAGLVAEIAPVEA